MSLLLSEGHTDAHQYPLGMVWVEAELVVQRQNEMEATRAVLLRDAVSAVISKKGQNHFKKTIEKLTGEN